jgi:hypothetical protein
VPSAGDETIEPKKRGLHRGDLEKNQVSAFLARLNGTFVCGLAIGCAAVFTEGDDRPCGKRGHLAPSDRRPPRQSDKSGTPLRWVRAMIEAPREDDLTTRRR